MPKKKCDFLILGSGVTGLFSALKLSELGTVVVITKQSDYESNTNYAQGGIASVISADDKIEEHIQDTLVAGAGLCDPIAVRTLVEEGPQRIRELIHIGVPFDRSKDGELDLTREGGHSQKRIVHAMDKTGAEVEKTLLAAVKQNPKIEIIENHMMVDLITRHHLKISNQPLECFGAYILNEETSEVYAILAKATILATGGAGQIYKHTTNPKVATGDGVASAYRAGANIRNMEFIQFHPTAFYNPGASNQHQVFLISEAVRGEGGILKTTEGVEFMENYHPKKELAPRDIVARAIDNEIKKSGETHVLLDISHKSKSEILKHFPSIYEHCLSHGIDISAEPIPVVPAAHYMCGGVATDLHGKTNIRNLYAAGEVASTGVHGGNRLASNSLLECVVFAERIFRDLKFESPQFSQFHDMVPTWDKEGTKNPEEWILISHDREEIKNLMNDYVGIVRSDLRLSRAKRRIDLILAEVIDYYNRTTLSVDLLELRNLAQVAEIVIRSALLRKESRGLHFSTNFEENRSPSRLDTVIFSI